MSMHAILWSFGGFEIVALAGSLALLRGLERQRNHAMRLQIVRAGLQLQQSRSVMGAGNPWIRTLVEAVGGAIVGSGLLSAATISKLKATVDDAGLHKVAGLRLFVGSKLIALLAFPLLTWVLLRAMHWPNALVGLLAAVAAVGGMLLPDMVIRRLHAAHARALERGLPDALDLMVICTEAGMGIEYALARAAQDLRAIHVRLAEQLVLVGSDLRVLSDRSLAFRNMGSRTGLDSFQRLGSTLLQSQQYGTPLGGSLRSLAAELREQAQTRFEAKAARLPVLLTLPMVVFILPCLFMIIGGPAGVKIAHAFSHH